MNQMPKINQEEYELLKSLGDNWKWIARDEDLSVYDDKPVKVHSVIPCWDISTEKNEWQRIDRSLFRFIQWGDREPHNIAELMEEYEKDYKVNQEYVIEFIEEIRRESEEAEVEKDKKWLVDKWTKERNETDVHDPMYQFISEFIADVNQLNEPETLSDDWLDDQPMNITQHRTIARELTDLYARKNQDYGDSFDESLDEDGLLVLKIRLGDKYKRFSTLINQKNEVVDESMRDTLIDLANYALMGVMWMDSQEEEE